MVKRGTQMMQNNDVRFLCTSSCLQEVACLIYLICVFCLIGFFFVFFRFFFFILCTVCCHFLWIVVFESSFSILYRLFTETIFTALHVFDRMNLILNIQAKEVRDHVCVLYGYQFWLCLSELSFGIWNCTGSVVFRCFSFV